MQDQWTHWLDPVRALAAERSVMETMIGLASQG